MMLPFLAAFGFLLLVTVCSFWMGRISVENTYDRGWWDGLKEAEEHLEDRASVTLAVAPEGGLSYASLRSLVFNQAAQDLAEIRRRVDCKPRLS